MSYHYKFDDTPVGNFRLARSCYEILQDGLRLLRAELDAWNDRAVEHGAASRPYAAEVKNLDGMIEWGDKKLNYVKASEIVVQGISIGSLRFAKAGLMLAIRKREEDRADKARQGWPEGAIRSLYDGIQRIEKIAQKIEYEPCDVLWEVIPKGAEKQEREEMQVVEWDVFISHASEDKEDFVRPLAEGLKARGLNVWYDEITLTVGDSLRQSIDRGLAHSRFGIVVISPNFMRKEWPQKELDGLVAREIPDVKVILPVWHGITADEIRAFSPILAGRLAVSSDNGLDHVIAELMRAIGASDDDPKTEPPSVQEYANSVPHNWQDGTIGGRTDTPPTDPHYWIKMIYGPHILLKIRFQGVFERMTNVQTMQQVRRYLLPLGGARINGSNIARNSQGPVVFLSAGDAPDVAISATQFYSWGELFAVDFHLLRPRKERSKGESKFIPTAAVEEILVDGLSNAITFARDGIKASFPIEVQVGLVGVLGYRLAVDPEYFYGDQFAGYIHQNQIGFSFSLKSLEDDPFDMLLPFFNNIYDAADEVRPDIRTSDRLNR